MYHIIPYENWVPFPEYLFGYAFTLSSDVYCVEDAPINESNISLLSETRRRQYSLKLCWHYKRGKGVFSCMSQPELTLLLSKLWIGITTENKAGNWHTSHRCLFPSMKKNGWQDRRKKADLWMAEKSAMLNNFNKDSCNNEHCSRTLSYNRKVKHKHFQLSTDSKYMQRDTILSEAAQGFPRLWWESLENEARLSLKEITFWFCH